MQSFGQLAENSAAEFLQRRGLVVLARNLRTPDAEIDILARERETLVIVEVKARRGRSYGSAVAAVDARKRARLRAAGADLLQFAPPGLYRLRFDVITVENGRVRYYREAFT